MSAPFPAISSSRTKARRRFEARSGDVLAMRAQALRQVAGTRIHPASAWSPAPTRGAWQPSGPRLPAPPRALA